MKSDNDSTPPEAAKKLKPKSRGERFQEAAQQVLDAVEAARTAFEKAFVACESALGDLENALEYLRDVRSEYEEWHGNMPENLLGSPLGEKPQAIVDIDLDIEAPEFEGPDLSDIEKRRPGSTGRRSALGLRTRLTLKPHDQ